MDQIQRALMQTGRKDLAQEYYQKIAGKKFMKSASVSPPYLHGLAKVSRSFYDLLVPMAQYVLTKQISEFPPKIASDTNFDKKMGLTDVQTDVHKTAVCIKGMTAVYDDKIITAFVQYGEFIVTAYAVNRQAAKEWMDTFENRMINENQYRGKCLYAESGSIQFREVPDTKWDDVVLTDKVKKDIRLNTVTFLGDKKMANAGVTKRGLMMYGPPGTGKTSIVKAVFRELHDKDISRIYVTAESFRRMSVGNLFDLMKYLGKTVLAFEDIDMVGTSRDIHLGNNLLGDLLTNLDGMRKHKEPIVIMASTNKLMHLDEALSNRPCRFDRKIEIGLPGDTELKNIYMKLVDCNIVDDVIKLSKDFTGSHVVEAVNTAKILAVSEDKQVFDCLIEACTIIRENFFPGQDTTQIKASAHAKLVKLGYKKGIQKKASNVKKTAVMVAKEIIVDTKIFARTPDGKIVKKEIYERYEDDGQPVVQPVI